MMTFLILLMKILMKKIETNANAYIAFLMQCSNEIKIICYSKVDVSNDVLATTVDHINFALRQYNYSSTVFRCTITQTKQSRLFQLNGIQTLLSLDTILTKKRTVWTVRT